MSADAPKTPEPPTDPTPEPSPGLWARLVGLFVETGAPRGATGSVGAEALRESFRLRGRPTRLVTTLWGVGCVLLLLVVWSLVTAGAPEERLVNRLTLPSPAEALQAIPVLFVERDLLLSALWSLGRIFAGFACVVALGLPIGILAGVFEGVRAFLAPLTLFLRYVPVAALVPLTILWAGGIFRSGIGEEQKILFLFVACFGFFVHDVTQAIASVEDRFVHTAATLGARPSQIVLKVLFPLALPSIVSSMRTILGVAFGYIVLAEVIAAEHGLGYLITISQRRSQTQDVYVILVLITALAFGIDRLVALAETWIFPYKAKAR